MGALSPIAARKKALQIFDFPFLFASDAEAAHVLDGPVGRQMLDGIADVTMILRGGYKKLDRQELLDIFKASLNREA